MEIRQRERSQREMRKKKGIYADRWMKRKGQKGEVIQGGNAVLS